MSHYRLGVDIGGTFTDFLLFDEQTGQLVTIKVPSQPDHPSQAVLEGLKVLSEHYGVNPRDIISFVHGTTLAVNTLIQRSGAVVGLLVTEGYRDILEIGRVRLSDPSQLYAQKPRPLVRRRYVKEIRERLLASGEVHLPLDLDQVEQSARELLADGATALAVSFLHSYRNPVHEQAAKARILEAFPDVYVCTSSEIWPQHREYERTLIASINAHIGRTLSDYFDALEQELETLGFGATILSTKSNGGIMTARAAARAPVETLLSGPAAGVIGASFIAREIDEPRIITLDMGGTSADVAVVDGDIAYSTESQIGDFPLLMPAVDIASIGAGGGSIVWLDDQGVLKVGPRSAGAYPGPACYGRGGTEPTVTDAYVVLGIIDPDHFLGGEQRLYPGLAEQALGRIGEGLGCSAEQAARYVLDVATANMYAEFVPLMARRGIDAREFALMAYGGAGPTHAFLLAQEVGMPRVIIPKTPGVLAALGCLAADFRADFVRTVHTPYDKLVCGQLETLFQDLEHEARAWVEEQRTDRVSLGQAPRLVRSADMRYRGQSFELTVPAPSRLSDDSGMADLLQKFHQHYELVYGYADRQAPVEVIDIRLQVVGETVKPRRRDVRVAAEETSSPKTPAPVRYRSVAIQEEPWEVPVYERNALRPGMRFSGPCVVEQYDTTVFVTPGFDVVVDREENLIATRRTG